MIVLNRMAYFGVVLLLIFISGCKSYANDNISNNSESENISNNSNSVLSSPVITESRDILIKSLLADDNLSVLLDPDAQRNLDEMHFVSRDEAVLRLQNFCANHSVDVITIEYISIGGWQKLAEPFGYDLIILSTPHNLIYDFISDDAFFKDYTYISDREKNSVSEQIIHQMTGVNENLSDHILREIGSREYLVISMFKSTSTLALVVVHFGDEPYQSMHYLRADVQYAYGLITIINAGLNTHDFFLLRQWPFRMKGLWGLDFK